jgi:hypothetical protein
MLTAGTAAQYPHYDCTSTGSWRSQVADTPQPGDHASIKTSCLTRRARRRAVFPLDAQGFDAQNIPF